MKTLFLDHDGVLCLSTEWGRRLKYGRVNPPKEGDWRSIFDGFNPKAVKVLNQIIEKTGAEIVVSSDWRYHGTKEIMDRVYIDCGVSKTPIGYTPTLSKCTWHLQNGVYHWDSEFGLEQERCVEIKQYLVDHPEVTHWVAIDDLNLGKTIKRFSGTIDVDWGLENFVLTPKPNEGIKQSGIKEKILEFLM